MVKIQVSEKTAQIGLKVFIELHTGRIERGQICEYLPDTSTVRVKWEDGSTSSIFLQIGRYGIFHQLEPISDTQIIAPGTKLVVIKTDDDTLEGLVVEYGSKAGELLSNVLAPGGLRRIVWNSRLAIHPEYPAPVANSPEENLQEGDYVRVMHNPPGRSYNPSLIYRISKVDDGRFQLYGGAYLFGKEDLYRVFKPASTYNIGDQVYRGHSQFSETICAFSPIGKEVYLGIGGIAININSLSRDPKSIPPTSDINVGDYVIFKNDSAVGKTNYKTDRIYKVNQVFHDDRVTIGGYMQFNKADLKRVDRPSKFDLDIGDTVVVRNPNESLLSNSWADGCEDTIKELSLDGTRASLVILGILHDMKCFVRVSKEEKFINSQIKHTKDVNSTKSAVKVQRSSPAIRTGQALGGCAIRVRKRTTIG